MDGMFENLGSLKNLDVIVADSAEQLRDTLRSIPLPSKVISIYAQGTRHYAWVLTSAPIKKVIKRKE